MNDRDLHAIRDHLSGIETHIAEIQNNKPTTPRHATPTDPWIRLSMTGDDEGWIGFPVSELIGLAYDGEHAKIRLRHNPDIWVTIRSHELARILDVLARVSVLYDAREG